MKSILLLSLLALGITLSTGAIAQTVSKTQVEARLKAEFAASDIDKNGVLTMDEIRRRTAHMRLGQQKAGDAQAEVLAQMWFAKADANKDGKVSQVEYAKLFYQTFSKYDTNGDGKISPAERAAAERDVKKGPPAR